MRFAVGAVHGLLLSQLSGDHYASSGLDWSHKELLYEA
jgi:hypothetical protein